MSARSERGACASQRTGVGSLRANPVGCGGMAAASCSTSCFLWPTSHMQSSSFSGVWWPAGIVAWPNPRNSPIPSLWLPPRVVIEKATGVEFACKTIKKKLDVSRPHARVLFAANPAYCLPPAAELSICKPLASLHSHPLPSRAASCSAIAAAVGEPALAAAEVLLQGLRGSFGPQAVLLQCAACLNCTPSQGARLLGAPLPLSSMPCNSLPHADPFPRIYLPCCRSPT